MSEVFAMDLMDIEPPLVPGMDWSGWLENAAEFVVLLVVLWFLVRLGRQFVKPVSQVWQLRRLSRRIHDSIGQEDHRAMRQWVWQLYGWLQLVSKKDRSGTTEERNAFMQQVEAAAFSTQGVSRETCLELNGRAWDLLKNRFETSWRPLRVFGSTRANRVRRSSKGRPS